MGKATKEHRDEVQPHTKRCFSLFRNFADQLLSISFCGDLILATEDFQIFHRDLIFAVYDKSVKSMKFNPIKVLVCSQNFNHKESCFKVALQL